MEPQPFTVRSPTLAEIPEWGAFVAKRGFAHRPGALDRFTQRFLCDPSADPSHIIAAWSAPAASSASAAAAATTAEAAPALAPAAAAAAPAPHPADHQLPAAVVGCVRLFFRSLALRADGSASASVTGWGEVCSEPELRGRGIVGLVLREALARMRGGGGGGGAAPPPCALALLHAAAGVASMYEKFGFAACLPIPYGQLAVGRSLPPAPAPAAAPAALPGHPRARLRAADFDADWAALEALRAAQAARLGLVGWTLRSEAYWRRWVRYAARSAALVLEVQRGGGAGSSSAEAEGSYAIAAYGYARWREGAWRAMDWVSVGGAAAAALGGGGGGAPEAQALPLLAAFAAALLAAGQAFHAAAGDAAPVPPQDASQLLPGGALALALPLALLQDVCGGGGGGEAREAPALADRGWMALDLRPQAASAEGGALQALAAAAAQGKFLAYPADYF